MPVLNSNSKISSRPDLGTQFLQIFKPTGINNLLCQKGKFTFQLFVEDYLLGKALVTTQKKVKIESFSLGNFACPKIRAKSVTISYAGLFFCSRNNLSDQEGRTRGWEHTILYIGHSRPGGSGGGRAFVL